MANSNFGISTILLSRTKENVGLGIIEIKAIPHANIISSGPIDSIVAGYKQDFSGLLSELYQQYKQFKIASGQSHEMSFEILWLSQPALNQPYRAKIRLFLIIRAIDRTEGQVQDEVSSCMQICLATLETQKYEVERISFEMFQPLLQQARDDSVRAIIKEVRLENLQNAIIPLCYSYDRIGDGRQDLGRIANALKEYPDCAVSFQLMPTEYTESETVIIDKTVQGLNILSQGVMEQGVGYIRNPLASKCAEAYNYYARNKKGALFLFNIIIYGDARAVENISTRVYGHINAAAGASTALQVIVSRAEDLEKNKNIYPLPWAFHEGLLRNPMISANRVNPAIFPENKRLSGIITAEEASEFFRLPIGSNTVAAGFTVNYAGKSGKTFEGNIINGADMDVGFLKASVNKDRIGFMLEDLTKHMLIVGTPGSGKTTFSISLLVRLWKEKGIPFLVIEPAKNEYRALVKSIPDLQIFTPGKSTVSPFLLNPFLPPRNVKLESYKATLKTAFTAAVTMSSPLDKIFEESVNNCYSDFKWLDSYTSADRGEIFNIADFVACFQKTFDAIGYTGDVRNIGKAGAVRLKSMSNLFDNYNSVPIEHLLQRPTVIELSAIENSDEKALLIALLLLSILAYVNSNYLAEGILKNVVLLEEAHVLLDAEVNKIPGEADPSGIAQRLIKRMLAEIRAYGVGIIIADQSPRKVTTDIVAMTDIKLAFRLVETGDRQMIADSTNMSALQQDRLSKLKPGEAFYYFHRLEEPEEIYSEDYRKQNKISITLNDDTIRSSSNYWNDKGKMLRPYPECQHVKCCSEECDRDVRSLAREIARRIYAKNLQSSTDDYAVIQSVWARLSALIKTELNGELFSRKLYACVMVRLSRLVKYETKVRIPKDVIARALEKVQG